MNEFITYAQNAEDVMLWRALKDIRCGFYIDVGAQDPVVDSVTKAFYERGWHGINIEPVHHWYDKLVQDRPHDINLCVATSSQGGQMTLYEVGGTGLSTSSPKFAQRHRQGGWTVQERTVPCKTLEVICTEHQVGTVHFLKIDCEGAEEQTLAGISLEAVRPWIILVEATEPLMVKPTWRSWEHWLTDRGYKFIYFDGLNRFYLAEERLKLRTAFRTPPNPLDWTRRAVEMRAQASIDSLTNQLSRFRAVEHGARTEAERDRLRGENEYREAELVRSRIAYSELQEALRTRDGQLAAFVAERDQLHGEKENREAEINRLRNLERDSYGKLQARDVQLAASIAERNQLSGEKENREAEINRLRNVERGLHGELRARGVQLANLALERDHHRGEREHRNAELTSLRAACRESETRIHALLVSRSWRITAPLRLCGRGARWFLHALLMATYVTLRPFAHLTRPALRRLANYRLIREMVTGTFGKRSRLVSTARLFLFGAPSSAAEDIDPASDSITQDRSQPEAVSSAALLSERGRTVRRLMDEMQAGVHEEGTYAHRF